MYASQAMEAKKKKRQLYQQAVERKLSQGGSGGITKRGKKVTAKTPDEMLIERRKKEDNYGSEI